MTIRIATRPGSRQCRRIDTESLLGEPDRVELAVQEVARGDGVAAHLAEMGDDAVPLQRVNEVHFLVVEPLLEGAEDLPALLRIRGPRLLDVQIVHHRVLVPLKLTGDVVRNQCRSMSGSTMELQGALVETSKSPAFCAWSHAAVSRLICFT